MMMMMMINVLLMI